MTLSATAAPRDLNIRGIVFWSGLALYVASFLLPAIVKVNSDRPIPGYKCAELSVLMALTLINESNRGNSFPHGFLESVSVFVVALINPAFLIYAIASLFRPAGCFVQFLRILIPLMIPFCWIIFHYEWFHPREGHFVWILGMLLVLASGYSVRRLRSPVEAVNGIENK